MATHKYSGNPAASTPRTVGSSADERRLRIEWMDGHASEFDPRYLRLSCPCAGCIEEMTGRPLLDPEKIPADVYLTGVKYVGRYALRFDWSDGHNTGIHPFDKLRDLCRCDECNP
jgi:ATP-binding protein involved in chromosome partitioning